MPVKETDSKDVLCKELGLDFSKAEDKEPSHYMRWSVSNGFHQSYTDSREHTVINHWVSKAGNSLKSEFRPKATVQAPCKWARLDPNALQESMDHT